MRANKQEIKDCIAYFLENGVDVVNQMNEKVFLKFDFGLVEISTNEIKRLAKEYVILELKGRLKWQKRT
ncbi:hypothetical protein [Campylobacter sp. MIT 97-5078]|uniref:hypothetical protein n=1 Tax=Campylobacter sp. MIT 97-5078 TaxID=1548153 RepID=UPI000514807A|nr:hypothetical protein [Campylobacter sp. MIT 97-5078]KGI55182.1 hypothetical protein LR59_13075 [Campylobacter sp. MIT 97-5078]TQR23052.1 hypothetical protein DMB91_08440 [Campylobacter sp. MIT 97-5078]